MLQEINFKIASCQSPPPLPAHAYDVIAVRNRMLLRRFRKERLRKVKNQEYRKLRALVPAVAKQSKVSKVTVIEETIKYIDELHRALSERLGCSSIDMNYFLNDADASSPEMTSPRSHTSSARTPVSRQLFESEAAPLCGSWVPPRPHLCAPTDTCTHQSLHLSPTMASRIS